MEDLGRVHLADDTIVYCSESYPSWKIGLNEIQVIGEFTNENGPYCQDHFLAFVADVKSCHELPCGAHGFSAMKGQLERHLNGHLELQLIFTTTFESAVLWPFEMKGQRLFHFSRTNPPTMWAKLLGLVGIHDVAQEYDQEIIRYLTATD